jgi:hypothetical protein
VVAVVAVIAVIVKAKDRVHVEPFALDRDEDADVED